MRRLCIALVAALFLSGCLGDVPTRGDINFGLENNAQSGENFVRTIVSPPVPGADPVGIVRGFLAAAASDDDKFATTRLFLTERASKAWTPVGELRIIDDRSQVWEYDNLRSPGLVIHRANLEGKLSVDGDLQASRDTRTDFYRLTLVDREWRIDQLPSGLTITRSDLDRSYRQVLLYFPDQSKKVLVPISLYVPVRPGLATSLVRTLLSGPAGWLGASLTTAFPSGSALGVESVPIVDGVANVGLNAIAATASSSDRSLMAAQLFYTLRQVPEFRTLELSAGGARISFSNTSWPNYSLARFSGDTNLYFNTDRDIYSLSLTSPEAQPLAFQASIQDLTKGFTSLAMDDSRSTLLSIDPTGDLTVAGISRAAGNFQINTLGPVLRTPGKLSQPQWDLQGRYWSAVMDKWELWSGQGSAKPSRVATPTLTNVEAFAIARDGIRLIVSYRTQNVSRIVALRVVRTSKAVRAERPRELWRSTDPITAMKADGAESIALLVGGKRLVRLSLRSGQVTKLALTPMAIAMAAHPGKSIVIETEDHRLLIWRGQKWVQLTTGRNPSYAG